MRKIIFIFMALILVILAGCSNSSTNVVKGDCFKENETYFKVLNVSNNGGDVRVDYVSIPAIKRIDNQTVRTPAIRGNQTGASLSFDKLNCSVALMEARKI